eukprot:GHUV01010919.1.p1 GENE.GHUV01010919.1~~GHUV01010919.1.p1  ORF type:complete len:638 (+),score=211.66 GHUV01010919.1:332-2245(+)
MCCCSPFAHPTEKIKRRDPRTHVYDCNMCPHVVKGEDCPQGPSCPHSHNAFESWLHPQKYRTLLCKDQQGCKRQICFFAHGRDQLRTPSDPPRTAVAAAGQPLAGPGDLVRSSSGGAGPYLQTAVGAALSGSHSAGLYTTGSAAAAQMQLLGTGAELAIPANLLRVGSGGSGSYSNPVGSLHNSSHSSTLQGTSPPPNSGAYLGGSSYVGLQAGSFSATPQASNSGLGMAAGGVEGSTQLGLSVSSAGPSLASVVEMPEMPPVHIICTTSSSSNLPTSQAVLASTSSSTYTRSCPLPVIGPDGRPIWKFRSLPTATNDEQMLAQLMEQVQLAWQESAPGSNLQLVADAATVQQLQMGAAVPAACLNQGYAQSGGGGTLAAAAAAGSQPFVVYAVPAGTPAIGHSSNAQRQMQTGAEASSFSGAQGTGQQQMILQLNSSSQLLQGQLQLVQQPQMAPAAPAGTYVLDTGMQLSQSAGPSASLGHMVTLSSGASQVLHAQPGGSQYAGSSLPVSQGVMQMPQAFNQTASIPLGTSPHIMMQPQLYGAAADVAGASPPGGHLPVASSLGQMPSGELVWKPSHMSASSGAVPQVVGHYVPTGSAAQPGVLESGIVVQPTVGWVVASQPQVAPNTGWNFQGN